MADLITRIQTQHFNLDVVRTHEPPFGFMPLTPWVDQHRSTGYMVVESVFTNGEGRMVLWNESTNTQKTVNYRPDGLIH